MGLYPSVFFIHSATLKHATGVYTVDEYGNEKPVIVESVISCRFGQQKEMISAGGTAVGYIISKPRVSMPPEIEISEEDKIESTVEGYEGTYNVISKKVVYPPVTDDPSHISCELAAVV